jgi:hypothetical protein
MVGSYQAYSRGVRSWSQQNGIVPRSSPTTTSFVRQWWCGSPEHLVSQKGSDDLPENARDDSDYRPGQQSPKPKNMAMRYSTHREKNHEHNDDRREIAREGMSQQFPVTNNFCDSGNHYGFDRT